MSILEQIKSAGIVGCGGAGFPTHVKLNGSFEYLIVNGAECEPLLHNDRYLMRNKAREIVHAITAVANELQIPKAVIALKAHYHDEVSALQAAVAELNAPVKLHLLESFYPAGDEQTIVYEVTGRVVPPAGLPGDVGAVVNNVATMYSVYQAMNGNPMTLKYLTITGEVKKPSILCVPIGTPLRFCIELAGGTKCDDFTVVTGGPMMGKHLPISELDNAVVTKTTSGILILPPNGSHARSAELSIPKMLNQARTACIQCTACTQLCPRHLLGHPLEPHRIMRRMADSRIIADEPVIRSALLCCECGICETYACPMDLKPRKINALIKQALGKEGIRYQRTDAVCTPSADREYRKAPAEKVAARVGVHKYYHYKITELISAVPEEVRIPVHMHIGAPAEPVVSIGQQVRRGDVIAAPQQGKLGAYIHASIDGYVSSVGDKITIVKERGV